MKLEIDTTDYGTLLGQPGQVGMPEPGEVIRIQEELALPLARS